MLNKKMLLINLLLLSSCGSKINIPSKVVSGNDATLASRLELISSNMIVQGSFQMNLQARLNPPVLSGLKGQSTSIDVKSNRAYVSFNIKGSAYQKGAVTILNLTSMQTPTIEKEIQFLDQDVNYVRFDNNTFNIVGAKASGNNGNAFFQQFTLDLSDNRSFNFDLTLPSYAGNYLSTDDNYYYVSSGDYNGGLSVFKKNDKSLKFYKEIQDSRSIGIQACGKEVNVLTGSNASVVSFSKNKIDTLATASGSISQFSGAIEKEARSEILSGVDYSIISLGENGFKVICNEDKSVKAAVSIPQRVGIDQDSIRTNGVSAQKGLIFAAQGGAGLYVYSFKKSGIIPVSGCQDVIVTELGHSDLTANDSVNSVTTTPSSVFTSNGKGGVEIFTFTKDTESDDIADFDSTYQAATCLERQMIAGCDSVKSLDSTGLVAIPARSNDKECFSLKIVNYQSNKASSIYTQRLDGYLVKDHDLGTNQNPRIMSHTLYNIKMMDSRSLYLSGSKYGLTNFYVDNFFMFKLTSVSGDQYYTMGTGDSAALGFTAPLVLLNSTYQTMPFDIKTANGVAQYTSAYDLSSKLIYPIATEFSLDSYALDAGVAGQTSDVYLIFK
jgi:hypothetical protein